MRLIAHTPSPTGTIGKFLDSHPHAFTRQELIDGWSQRRFTTALRRGDIARVLPAIYAGAAHADEPVVVGEAVNLWHPPALVTGPMALHLYAPQLPRPVIVDVEVPTGQHLRAPAWVRLRQTEPARASIDVRGVSTVEMPRALLDTWAITPSSQRRDVLYAALWARVCTWRQLELALSRRARIPGRDDLQRVLGWFAQGATSPLEVRAQRDVFAGERFREFEWQVAVDVGRRRFVADMLHRRAGVVVELDGQRYHSSPEAQATDRARDIDLAAAGLTTIRFTWSDMTRRPEWCRERLLAVLVSRLAARSTESVAAP